MCPLVYPLPLSPLALSPSPPLPPSPSPPPNFLLVFFVLFFCVRLMLCFSDHWPRSETRRSDRTRLPHRPLPHLRRHVPLSPSSPPQRHLSLSLFGSFVIPYPSRAAKLHAESVPWSAVQYELVHVTRGRLQIRGIW